MTVARLFILTCKKRNELNLTDVSVDISNTEVSSTVNSSGKIEIAVSRLAGNTKNSAIRLFENGDAVLAFMDVSLFISLNSVFVYFSTLKRSIYKGSRIEIHLTDKTIIKKYILTGATKLGMVWKAIVILSSNEIIRLSTIAITQIIIADDSRKTSTCYTFGEKFGEQYSKFNDAVNLFMLVCSKLIEEARKSGISIEEEKPKPAASYSNTIVLPKNNAQQGSMPQGNTNDGPILNRQYNLNTKYGRAMARRQAAYNYQHGSQEYRNSIDQIGCVVWAVIIAICFIVFLIIASVRGPEAAIKWLR